MVYNLKLSYILKDGMTEECELKLFTWTKHGKNSHKNLEAIYWLWDKTLIRLQLDITNESQEVIPFPAGDHKATTNRPALKA